MPLTLGLTVFARPELGAGWGRGHQGTQLTRVDDARSVNLSRVEHPESALERLIQGQLGDDLSLLSPMESGVPYIAGTARRALALEITGATSSGLLHVGPAASGPINFAMSFLTTKEYLSAPLPELVDRRQVISGLLEQFTSGPDLRAAVTELVVLGLVRTDETIKADLVSKLAQALPGLDGQKLVNRLRVADEPCEPLARQLILGTIRRILSRDSHGSGPSSALSAMFAAHLLGELMEPDEPGADEPLVAGLPQTLAIELFVNQHFNSVNDVHSLLERSLRLWSVDTPKIKVLCAGRTPADLVRQATGIEVEDFLALGFGFMAHALTWKPGQPPFVAETLGVGMDEAVRQAFLSHVAATPAWFKERFASTPGGDWDFIAIQERPILHMDGDLAVLDTAFLCERVTNGLYWIVHDYLRDVEGEAARHHWTQAWGEVTELCVEEQLTALPVPLLGNGVLLYTEEDLQAAYPGQKNADVVIDTGPTWLVFEIVSGQLKVASRVTGQHNAVMEDFEKLVFKKLRQLSATADSLITDSAALIGGDLPAIVRRVRPVVVAAAGFPVNPISCEIIAAQIEAEHLFSHALIEEVCILDMEEIDLLEGLRERGEDPAEVLNAWKRSGLARMSFKNYVFDRWGGLPSDLRPARLSTALPGVLELVKQRLRFPDQDGHPAEEAGASSVDG